MRSEHDAGDCLRDIVENARRIQTYTVGLNRAGFVADDRTRDAVERCLERISEAAHRLGRRAADLMPEQPWPDIRGMGNRLRHGYDRLDADVLWNVVDTEIAGLLTDARGALGRLSADER